MPPITLSQGNRVTLLAQQSYTQLRTLVRAHIIDEYRKKNPSKADYRTKKPLKVFDHQIHQKLATDVIGVSFDAQ